MKSFSAEFLAVCRKHKISRKDIMREVATALDGDGYDKMCMRIKSLKNSIKNNDREIAMLSKNTDEESIVSRKLLEQANKIHRRTIKKLVPIAIVRSTPRYPKKDKK